MHNIVLIFSLILVSEDIRNAFNGELICCYPVLNLSNVTVRSLNKAGEYDVWLATTYRRKELYQQNTNLIKSFQPLQPSSKSNDLHIELL